jgi:secreted trypsin-like serine protease
LPAEFEALRRRQEALEDQLVRLRAENRTVGEALVAHLRSAGGEDPAGSEKWGQLADYITTILGGVASTAGQFPQVATILAQDTWHGSGVLIAPRIVLTAAHTLTPPPSAVALNTLSVPPASPESIAAVRAFNFNPAFTGGGGHDIGFMALRQDSKVKPIALASSQELTSATEVTLVGFGFDEFGKNHVLRNVTTKIHFAAGGVSGAIPPEVAAAGFNQNLEFLVGVPGKGACLGDSGGPALVQTAEGLKLAGIISRGPGNACTGLTIVERIDVDLEWIAKVIATN